MKIEPAMRIQQIALSLPFMTKGVHLLGTDPAADEFDLALCVSGDGACRA